MSDEDDSTSGALNHGESSVDYAKHWTNKSDSDATLPVDDVDVKTDWIGITVYLPESLREELDLVFQEHSLECKRSDGMDLRKLQHYYPLVIALGLELLESTNSEEIAPLVSYITEEYE